MLSRQLSILDQDLELSGRDLSKQMASYIREEVSMPEGAEADES